MATSIFFNGRRTFRPGVYTQILNNLGTQGPASTGNLAVVGDFPMLPTAEPVVFNSRLELDDFFMGLDRDAAMIGQLAFAPFGAAGASISSLTMLNAGTSTAASFDSGSITYASRLAGSIGHRISLAVSANAANAELFDVAVSYSGNVKERATGIGSGAVASFAVTDAASTWSIVVNETTIVLSDDGVAALTITKADEPSFKQAMIDMQIAMENAGATVTANLPSSDFPCSDLDHVSVADVNTNGISFTKDVADIADWFAGSALISVTVDSHDASSLTFTSQALTGGSFTAMTDSSLQTGLDALKRLPINTIAFMDSTIAKQLLVKQHCKDAAADAGYNRNAWFGTSAGQTVAQAKAGWSVRLNDADCAVTPQSIKVGGRTLSPSWTALLFAGMQNATPAGTPLTKKQPTPLVTDTVEGFDREDDAEAAIRAGLVFMSNPFNLGLSVERSVTTWLEDDNRVWSEVSANESVNQSVRNVRAAVLSKIGSRITSSTANDLSNVVENELVAQRGDGLILNFANVEVLLSGDTARVQYDVQATESLNFITITANVR